MGNATMIRTARAFACALLALPVGNPVAAAKTPAPSARREYRVPWLGLDLAPISPGQFLMGSPDGEPGHHANEAPLTTVSITHAFWLGRYEVTQRQWSLLMHTSLADQARFALDDDALYLLGGKERTIRERIGLTKASRVSEAIGNVVPDVPIYWVNWDEAVAFCRRLTAQEHRLGHLPRGYVYRLPTEAEWEYAARAGTTEATYAGPIAILGERNAPALDAIAWYSGNSSVGYSGKGWPTADWTEKQYPGGTAGPRRIGTRQPNPWHLYDMLGNVNEWVADWYGDHLRGGTVRDPVGAASGTMRVIRGGSWFNAARGERSADRDRSKPARRFFGLGFRIALAPELPAT
jgi:sulfatase modifying factor 1